jgi:hypothetical protein
MLEELSMTKKIDAPSLLPEFSVVYRFTGMNLFIATTFAGKESADGIFSGTPL